MDQPSTILIVDDDRLTRKILEGLLSPEGYRLATASDGDEALAMAAELMPDLVLLDVMMPGLDGYEVCRRLRQTPNIAEVPVIMVTALDDRESRFKGMDAGADDFVSKPFDKAELQTRVRTITRLNRFRRLHQERSLLQRTEEELHRRVGELELINEALNTISTTLETDDLLEVACRTLARAFAPAQAATLRIDAETATYRCVGLAQSSTAEAGQPPIVLLKAREEADALPLVQLPYTEAMLRSGEPRTVPGTSARRKMIREAVASEAAWPNAIEGGGEAEAPESGGSSLAVPILLRDQVFGVFELEAEHRSNFEDLDLALAESIVTAVGQSLETAQLYERLRRYADDLEDTVERRTRELAAERDRTHAILEALGEAAFVTDVAGRLQYINPAGVALTGYTREEMLGLRFWEWHPDRRIERFFEQVRERDLRPTWWEGELVGRRKDGTYFDAVLTLAPLGDPEDADRVTGFVGVQRDITPLKEAERLKERFVSNVSHELRTPLSVITLLSGNLDALDERLDADKRREMIQDIRRHALVLDELIRDVLEISSIDSGRIRPEIEQLDLAPLVREECHKLAPLAERNDQEILAKGPETLLVKGDAQQLRRVIRNLVNNAMKYSPEKAEIRCEWGVVDAESADETDWPGVSKLREGHWAAVRVVDAGIGIAEEDLDRIFERFYRVNTQGNIPGTGLGLSITRELIGLHSGHLSVSSRIDEGSIFAFYLPLFK